MENWFDIKGQEGKYQISDKLRVKRLSRIVLAGRYYRMMKERICTIHTATNGYSELRFGQHEVMYMHRIVAEAFIPNPLNLPQINHKNGAKTDYSIDNLEWCTSKQNNKHAFDTGLNKGTPRYGSDNSACKINIEIVNQIKSLKGKQKLKETASQFKISVSHVWQLQNNKNRQFK